MKKYILIFTLSLLMPIMSIQACDIKNPAGCDREGLIEIIKQIIISRTKSLEKPEIKPLEEIVKVPAPASLGLLEASILAKYAESLTGVDGSVILAIISRESSSGERFGGGIGNCYLKDIETGEGVDSKGNTVKRVMSPDRDIPSFLEITKDLGVSHDSLLVSCPMGSSWGGAIGIGQFIPSSWSLVSKEVTGFLGKVADPWAVKDGILAIAVLLQKNGVADNPRLGICRYHSGRCTANGEQYADDILSKADLIKGKVGDMLKN